MLGGIGGRGLDRRLPRYRHRPGDFRLGVVPYRPAKNRLAIQYGFVKQLLYWIGSNDQRLVG